MLRIFIAGTLAAGTAFAAYAQDNNEVKLSQVECEALWNQVSADGAPITESQAAPYISNFSAANPDGDNTIEKDEWAKACDDGLVRSAGATTGAGAGEGGAGADQMHPPTNRMGDEVPTMTPEQSQ